MVIAVPPKSTMDTSVTQLPVRVQQEIIKSIKNANHNRPPRRALWRTAIQAITALFTSWIIFAIPATIFVLIIFPFYFLTPYAHYMVGAFMCYLTWTLTSFIFDRQGVVFSFSGLDDIPEGESAFVITNHKFFGDFFCICCLARAKGMMGYIRTFVKWETFRIPLFGWSMYLNNFPGLKRNWGTDKGKLQESIRRFIDYKFPIWLVSHVEGTRFNAKNAAKSREFTDSRGMPPLNYVILPRYKGFWATICALRDAHSHVKEIYDVTMCYYHERKGFGYKPTLRELGLGKIQEMHVHMHVERIPISEVPLDEQECAQWLYQRFYRKDAVLEVAKCAFEDLQNNSISDRKND